MNAPIYPVPLKPLLIDGFNLNSLQGCHEFMSKHFGHNWFDLINRDTLRLGDPQCCIIGQVTRHLIIDTRTFRRQYASSWHEFGLFGSQTDGVDEVEHTKVWRDFVHLLQQSSADERVAQRAGAKLRSESGAAKRKPMEGLRAKLFGSSTAPQEPILVKFEDEKMMRVASLDDVPLGKIFEVVTK